MAYDKTRLQEVKSKISVPMYFYNVIIPQRSDYYSDYPVDFDARPVCKCPLHDEDTPSMRFYEETNTFYCFGCRAGGDVIELHRKYTEKMNGARPSFENGIDFLYDFFIKGNTTARAIKLTNKLTEEKLLSTPIEMARYSKYSDLLEKQILVDTSIRIEVKEALWELIDNIDLLVSKNYINAVSGMNYIKDKVKELLNKCHT